MSDNAIRTFFCLIGGENELFKVEIAANQSICRLKEIIHQKAIERPILAKNLTVITTLSPA